MTDRIVVGIDFSAPSVAAAEWAARELPRDAELVLAHVMPRLGSSAILRSRLPKPAVTADTLRVGADHKLLALANSLRPRRVWPEILEGDAAAALSEVAAAFDARMIVVGTHGAGSIAPGLGSTASALMVVSGVPLVVLSGTPPTRPFHILAPVDRRESAHCVVSETRRLFAEMTSRLTLLHVIPSNVMKHFMEQGEWDDEDYAGEFEWVDRWSRLARDAGWPAHDVRSEEALGNPAREIRAAATRLGADFVIMPRRNGLSIRRALLGSVTESVLRDPPCSVIILPEPTGSTRESSDRREATHTTSLSFAGMIV